VSSLRRRLLAWTGMGLAIGLLAATAAVGVRARASTGELLDEQMARIAGAVPARALGPMPPPRLEGLQVERDIVIQIWDNSGLRIYASHAYPTLPGLVPPGFHDVRGPAGEGWRVYAVPVGGSVVQVAQPQAARDALVLRAAVSTVAPMLVLFPLLGLLLWVGLGRGLAPLRRLAGEAGSRGAGTLAPFAEAGLDDELRPLVRSLNGLLGRLGEAIDAQRGFVADAAHTLRTPLAALTLQAQLAERAEGDGDGAARAAAFAELRRGLRRANRLVEQLLTLARQEPGGPEPAPDRVDLAAIARAAVADAAAAAEARGVDLGLARDAPLAVAGDADALRILIENLVDNALRHAPPGTAVDVSVGADGTLAVEDRGPGLPPAELDAVFERFRRGQAATGIGSGLGLAIVRRIAERHGARASLANRVGGGLRAEVRFPALEPRSGHPRVADESLSRP
jgi:two-component system OmpR family sensor kinase